MLVKGVPGEFLLLLYPSHKMSASLFKQSKLHPPWDTITLQFHHCTADMVLQSTSPNEISIRVMSYEYHGISNKWWFHCLLNSLLENHKALYYWPYMREYSISQEICTRFCCALLCCGYAIVHNEFTWSIYPYSSGLLCWHWGNR